MIGSADGYADSSSNFAGESSVSGIGGAHTSVRAASAMRGRTVADGTADGVGEALSQGQGKQKSLSDARGTSENEGESEQEALMPILEERSGGAYSLEEHKHRATMRLANLPERHAIVKVQNLPPVEIIVDTVEPAGARPQRVAEFVALLTASDEYTKPRVLIEQELAERPLKLIQAAAEFASVRAQARRRVDSDEAFDDE
jgi:hypothetical protein